MTLNGVMALFCVISANSGSFRAHCVKVHDRYLISQVTEGILKLETVSIAEPLQNRQRAPLMLSTLQPDLSSNYL